MSVYPLQFFTDDSTVGFTEDYKSSPLNRKYAGQPKGAYVGFIPSAIGSELVLDVDPTFGYSLIKVPSNADSGGLDIVVDEQIRMEFLGQPSVDFPLLVIARATYFDDPNNPTRAEIITRSSGQPGFDEVLICEVDGPDTAISVRFSAVIGERDEPLAFQSTKFGFMPGGSIENLQAAADVVNEVVAARIGLDATVHPDLSSRIAEDYSASSMAGRLALVSRVMRSNDYSISLGDDSVVVSGSFTEIDRDHEPKVTLEGVGSETVEGALAGPNDLIRNVAVIVDADTGYRPVDDPTDRRVTFGRLTGPAEAEISGQWTFLNASKDVSATEGQATTDIKAGDTIRGGDGKHYEVETITDDVNIVLRTAYASATATVDSTIIRRWELSFKRLNVGTEEDAILSGVTNLRFFFPSFLSMEQGSFDWRMALHTSAERAPLAAATTTVPGTVRLADTFSLLGSVNIQNAGGLLGGGPFHTINFNDTNASVVATGTPGEVEVVEIGPEGPDGPQGPTGATGDTGVVGVGYSVLNTFEIATEIASVWPGPEQPWSFTKDMGHNIRYLHGNVSSFRDRGQFTNNNTFDYLNITEVETISLQEGRISGNFSGDVNFTPFLSSAGD